MSSCQSFLRQRVVGTTTLNAVDTTQLYTFVAGGGAAGTTAYAALAAGNYIGNYPPGYLVAGPTVAELASAAQGGVVNPIIRDMGKTIKASLADAAAATQFGTPGFWREIQVLSPVTVSGPTIATNNGVTGQAAGFRPSFGNNGDGGYQTFYVPIVVDGVVPSNSAGTAPLTVTGSPSLALGNVQ
jgi:hypothetical protein